jgi:methylase of polypeptide subunit release factors
MDTAAIGTAPDSEAARFWDDHYRAPQPAITTRVNPLLAEITATLTPGAALDLGCGAGGDALWLAGGGWRVTAVDISANGQTATVVDNVLVVRRTAA